MAGAVILGLETSCDETSAALIDGRGVIHANVISSQARLHAAYGGVVPEIASRRHLELVTPVLREALDQAGATLAEIDTVAVTAGPGLIGALLVGVAYAKALSLALEVPLVAVNHLHGHVASLYLQPQDLEPPFTCLLASGGHTLLLEVSGRGWEQVRRLGATRDDAAGEAFDKGARLLGLPYPGGSSIDRLAREGDPAAYAFPVARLDGLDFSFSGLKTALLYAVRDLAPANWPGAGPTSRRATSMRSCGRWSAGSRRAAPNGSRWSAGSPRTPSCAPRSPTRWWHRRRCAPITPR